MFATKIHVVNRNECCIFSFIFCASAVAYFQTFTFCKLFMVLSLMVYCSLQVGGVHKKVTITLNDCLACSGCVTSAETVLITQQSQHELYRILSDNKKSQEVFGLSV